MRETEIRVDASPVEQLVELFERQAAWLDATRYLEDGAAFDIQLTTRPGEVWHIARSGGETRLLNGAARDPDFVFCFTPRAVSQLAEAKGDVGDVTVRFLHLATERAAEDRIELRAVAPFARLVRRGYLSLLAAGGLRVLAFGAAHGVRTLGDLRKLVARLRGADEVGRPTADPAEAHVEQRGLRLRIRRTAREIGAQHDRLRELVKDINDALARSDGERSVALVARYRDALAAHFALEEEVVFPALHGLDPTRGPEIEALLREHEVFFRDLSALLAAAAEARSGDWKARFYAVRRALALHEGREEALVNAEVRASHR